jgi:hypothetical protein
MVTPLFTALGVGLIFWSVKRYMESEHLSSIELANFNKAISFEYQEDLRKRRLTMPERDFRKIDPTFVMPQVPSKGEPDI